VENIELECDDKKYKASTLDLSAGGMKIQTAENLDIEKNYKVVLKLSNEQEIKCKYQLIRVERGDNNKYTISGRFTQLSNIDKMVLVQYCMQKEMENQNR
jgi:c-di-GMP-binding flagellar brake protein YcgR